MMKLWQYRGLCKVAAIANNVFQFIFEDPLDREKVMLGRPWLFDNQLMVLQRWDEELKWTDERFNLSPIWIQVKYIPPHWLSVDTGRKIGSMLGEVKDVMIVETWGKEDRHIKIQVDLDLTKALIRGMKLKYRQTETWVEFRYEQLPTFCFYCGHIGHNEKLCAKRNEDLRLDKVMTDQCGFWLRAESRKIEGSRFSENLARAGQENEGE